jgi:hypothetical protein
MSTVLEVAVEDEDGPPLLPIARAMPSSLAQVSAKDVAWCARTAQASLDASGCALK